MKTPNDDAANGKKKPSAIVTIAIVAVLSLVAAGGGWMLGGAVAPHESPEPHLAAEGDKEKDDEAVTRVVDLQPITTNLGYPSENWVRLEVALLYAEEPDEALSEAIHQDILGYLRTVSLQQIEGPRGFQYLREDLMERVALRGEGKVANLMVRTFVIE
jgi:flagellar FliL protein